MEHIREIGLIMEIDILRKALQEIANETSEGSIKEKALLALAKGDKAFFDAEFKRVSVS